jgi:hypothetical protein
MRSELLAIKDCARASAVISLREAAPHHTSKMNIPSLMNPPTAPTIPEKMKEEEDFFTLDKVRRSLFANPREPATTPPSLKKKDRRRGRKRMDLPPLPLDLDNITPPTPPPTAQGYDIRQAKFLAASGDVREKYLKHSPEEIAKEEDGEYLEELWELYFPCSQPRNLQEHAYLELMRDCINERLLKLHIW